MGIQASGKSSFYRENFFNSHVRISLDLLKTKNRHKQFLQTCFATQAKFVIDNTNPSKDVRAPFIEEAKANEYKVIGYYFNSYLKDCLQRNSKRKGKERIPDVGVVSCYKRLERPAYTEGFDELYFVELKNGEFIVTEWKDEV